MSLRASSLWKPILILSVLVQLSNSQLVPWNQDKFVVSFWVDPIVPAADFPSQYATIRAANFTMLLGGFGATDPMSVSAQVKACDQAGLGCLVADCDGCPDAASKAGSSFWGLQVRDEPSVADFSALAQQLASFKSAYPDKLGFINLLPNYASPAQLGAPTYGAYVDAFILTVKPQILCVDHYPNFLADEQTGNASMSGYRENLSVLRERSLQAGIGFWNFFNTMPFGSHTDPSEAQIRWQVFTSLAYGAKGVLYFCYWTPKGSEFIKGGAIMMPVDTIDNYVRGPHYFHAQRINSVLVNYGAVLLRANSTAVYLVDGSSDPKAVLASSPVESIGDTPWSGGAAWDEAYLIGEFRLEDSRTALVVHNHRFDSNLWPTIVFRNASAVVLEVDRSSGEIVPVQDCSPGMPGLQLDLAAGDGRVLILE
mmetsp:Transcript_28819/g.66595  ORF Transcript_28819/g.66595 Transcript_28819/m.66595 type:complete len:425 (-) Transcript_28819:33-1307(-)